MDKSKISVGTWLSLYSEAIAEILAWLHHLETDENRG